LNVKNPLDLKFVFVMRPKYKSLSGGISNKNESPEKNHKISFFMKNHHELDKYTIIHCRINNNNYIYALYYEI